jgi:UDP-N-acetylmuramoyl-L-alanyl-D-glutamate--2,6-diaminopimelate ligase
VKSAEPRLTLATAAAAFYPQQPATVAAVTGTNGKSSTVDFLRQIWAHMGRKAASMGTLGAIGPSGSIDLGHTTPDPVMIHETLAKLANEGVTHAAMEASSHGLAQYRLHGVKLAAGAFTNLTQDHLDYHANFDDYRRAKLKLFSELLPKGAPAVINADSAELDAFEAGGEGGRPRSRSRLAGAAAIFASPKPCRAGRARISSSSGARGRARAMSARFTCR